MAASQHQQWAKNLPNLPVPKLSQTMDKYLKSVQPFLNEAELNHTKKLIQQFQAENGIGSKLQKLLVQKALQTDNWLSDWWLNVAYLEYRDPVVVYSSPGLVFPAQDFAEKEQQLDYCAKLILAALDYKSLIDKSVLFLFGIMFIRTGILVLKYLLTKWVRTHLI